MLKVNYNGWQRRIGVKVVDNYDYYLTVDDTQIGFPMDHDVARQVAMWLPSAMDDLINVLEPEGV